MDLHRLVGIPVVLDRILGFRIRAQIGHQLRFPVPDIREGLEGQVAQVEGQRHVIFRIAAGVPEHHALVAGSLLERVFALDAPVDVRTLLMQGGQDAAAVPVEHIGGFVVADAVDGVADRRLDVDIGLRVDFAHDDDHAGRTEGFAGDFGFRIATQEFVQDGVRNLIRHFVGMSFGHRLRSKKIVHFLAFFNVVASNQILPHM